jgi:NhaP-type Na+/H+ or K+/H+ antiporter
LFTDAARINGRELRHDIALPGRLLGVGLPLTIGFGALVAYGLEPGAGWGAALLVAACLAPTDAGLGAVIVSDPVVPGRIRRVLNVESGLNDGIAAPVVTLAIALVAEAELGDSGMVTAAIRELGLGVLVGVVVGGGCGRLVSRSRREGWIEGAAVPITILAVAVLANSGSIALGGNGFIAAFVAGLAFGPSLRSAGGPESSAPLELAELGGQVLGAVVWFLFGAALLGRALSDVDGRMVGYALLSLTVLRMAPVAVALVGTRLELPTVAFLGWFGPRGLASLVFAIEAIDELGPLGETIVQVVGLTVLLSVVAHGASARPLAGRYGRWSTGLADDHPAHEPVGEVPTRRWLTAGGAG